jgi:hypothetical protein
LEAWNEHISKKMMKRARTARARTDRIIFLSLVTFIDAIYTEVTKKEEPGKIESP